MNIKNYKINKLQFICLIAIIFFVTGCTHIWVPDKFWAVPLEDVGKYKQNLEISLINVQDDSELQPIPYKNSLANFHQWTDFLVENLKKEFVKRGIGINKNSKKSLNFKITSINLGREGSFFTAYTCKMKIEVSSADKRFSKEYKVVGKSVRSYYRTFRYALLKFSKIFLSDQELRKYLFEAKDESKIESTKYPIKTSKDVSKTEYRKYPINKGSKEKINAGVNLGLFMPQGDFGDAFGSGLKLGFTVDYRLQENIIINGEIGYIKLEAKDVSELKFTEYPINAGVKYLIPMEGQLIPYVKGGLGMYMQKITYGDGKESANEFGCNIGGGASYSVVSNMFLSGEIVYDLVADTNALNLMFNFKYQF